MNAACHHRFARSGRPNDQSVVLSCSCDQKRQSLLIVEPNGFE